MTERIEFQQPGLPNDKTRTMEHACLVSIFLLSQNGRNCIMKFMVCSKLSPVDDMSCDGKSRILAEQVYQHR